MNMTREQAQETARMITRSVYALGTWLREQGFDTGIREERDHESSRLTGRYHLYRRHFDVDGVRAELATIGLRLDYGRWVSRPGAWPQVPLPGPESPDGEEELLADWERMLLTDFPGFNCACGRWHSRDFTDPADPPTLWSLTWGYGRKPAEDRGKEEQA